MMDLRFLLSVLALLLVPASATKLSIVIAPSRTVVSGQKVQISCYIDDLVAASMSRFTLYLYCPAFSRRSGVSCFQNCLNSCAQVTRCPQRPNLSAFSCTRYSGSRSLTYEYTVEKVEKRHAGDYRCSFYGMSSATVQLKVLDPALLRPAETAPPLPQPTRPTRLAVRTTKRPVVVPPWRPPPHRPPVRWTNPPAVVITQAPMVNVRREGSGDDSSVDGFNRLGDRGLKKDKNVQGLVEMGERLLFVVVLLFVVSLVINSVFCIRCILIYFYGTDEWRQVKMGSLLCMNEEIRVYRDLKADRSLTYTSLGTEFAKHPNMISQRGEPFLTHPDILRRQHSADLSHQRHSYHQQYAPKSRPHSQQSGEIDSTTIPRVMRVVSEIELQPGEELDESTVMYVPLPVVVQRNGSIPNGNHKSNGRRPVSVVFSPGQDGHLMANSRPRLSTSVSGIDRIQRRSSQDLPHKILSMESVFEMETLHE